jgi:hypothetical protein
MKIDMIYNKSNGYNGIERYRIALDSGLKALGVVVNPIMLKKYEIKIKNKYYGGWQTEKLFKHFVKTDNEIIHSISDRCIIKNTNVVTIHDIYNNEVSHYKKVFKQIEELQVIVPSNYVKSTIENYAYNIAVIPQGVKIPDMQYFNPYKDDGKMHLITMGKIHKNFHNKKLIYVLYEWLKDNPNIDLYHIGKITDEKYLNYAKNIHNLQNVSENVKYAYLKYADKFVYNTEDEGQGLPTMEAMALNTQPIINDLPVHRELLGDKPYYYHNKEEFMDLLEKPKKDGLPEQIKKYDGWIYKILSVYNKVS